MAPLTSAERVVVETKNFYPYILHLQLSTFNVQRSTFNCQRSTFNVQLSTFNVQRSTFNFQLSTFNSTYPYNPKTRKPYKPTNRKPTSMQASHVDVCIRGQQCVLLQGKVPFSDLRDPNDAMISAASPPIIVFCNRSNVLATF